MPCILRLGDEARRAYKQARSQWIKFLVNIWVLKAVRVMLDIKVRIRVRIAKQPSNNKLSLQWKEGFTRMRQSKAKKKKREILSYKRETNCIRGFKDSAEPS